MFRSVSPFLDSLNILPENFDISGQKQDRRTHFFDIFLDKHLCSRNIVPKGQDPVQCNRLQ